MLKHVITALLLLALPLSQARAFVICPMDEVPPPANDCACPHAHPHAQRSVPEQPSPSDADHGDCCEVEFAPADTSSASASAQHDDFARAVAPHGDSTEIVVLPPVFAPVAAATRAVLHPPTFGTLAADRSRVFLLTGRLRL